MAARSIGTATISFGLVSIPVKLFTTGESSSGISFNLMHEKCKSRLKQHYICPKDGETVERSAMVKGYEYAKDQYVVFTPDELKALEETASKSIGITEFVPLAKVDPLFFEKGYYLGPEKGAEKSYRLLSKAMRETGRCALAKYAARGKMYLVLLRPLEDGICMQELRYADEVKSFSEVPHGEGEVKDAELKLAKQLIDQIASDEFKPENYRDEVKDRVLAQIQRKVQGESVTLAPEAPPQGQIIDLMEALKASLAKSDDEPRKAPKRAPSKEPAEAKQKKSK
jgi:DNA end-binding protein Ku